jgi:hypothetical protein
MAPDIENALKLQRLDTRIVELKQEIAALPRHIAEIEKALVSHQRKLEADQAALSANQKERRKLEGDIQLIEQKISKFRDQMNTSKKITNEQHRAFQKEIEWCENEIRKAEDRILDLMGEAEPLEANVRQAAAALEDERRQVEREKKAARERSALDERQLDQCLAERRETASALSPRIAVVYERVRRKHGNLVVADGSEGRCSACRISLRPQFFQDLKAASEPLPCESCGRLLYIAPPPEDPAAAEGL